MAGPEISTKNTKAEILDALNAALERAEKAEKARLNPEKTEKDRNEKRAVESAKKSIEQNIFSKELNEKFVDLQAAIAVEEDRLQDLYGVGRELQKLALVIEAGKERIAEIEAEKSTKIAEMEAERIAKITEIDAERTARIAEMDAEKAAKEDTTKKNFDKLKKDIEQKSTELQSEYDTYAKKLKIERTRENEEYQYNLTRTRERDNNSWADDKAARESELQKRETKVAELLADAESKVEYIRSLEEKVEKIPDLLKSEKESAVASTTDTLKREHKHQTALAEMECKNSVARLEDKVAYLQKELDSANKAVVLLQGKLDKAYSEIRDLATKTVETAGSVKIISNTEKPNV